MPIYEYECKHCHHQFEVMQKISDAKLTECPACHQSALQKLVSASGFQLKGSGWYVTDFKDKQVPKTDKKTEAVAAPAATTDTVSKSED